MCICLHGPIYILFQGARGTPGDQGPEGPYGSKVGTLTLKFQSHQANQYVHRLELWALFFFLHLKGWSRTQGCTWTSREYRFWVPWSQGTFGLGLILGCIKNISVHTVPICRKKNLPCLPVHLSLFGNFYFSGWQGEPRTNRPPWTNGYRWTRDTGEFPKPSETTVTALIA